MVLFVALTACAPASSTWTACEPGETTWHDPAAQPMQGSCEPGYVCPPSGGLRGWCLVRGATCTWGAGLVDEWYCVAAPELCEPLGPDHIPGASGGCAVRCERDGDCEGDLGCRSGWCGPLRE